MQLDDRILENVVKILHNSKGSVFNNVLRWTNSNENQEKKWSEQWQQQSPHPIKEYINNRYGEHSKPAAYYTKNNPEEEHPSIFGDQPVTEFEQQPVSDTAEKEEYDNINDIEDRGENEKVSDSEIEDQLTDEQRSTLEGIQREEEIEQKRASFEGFVGDQR